MAVSLFIQRCFLAFFAAMACVLTVPGVSDAHPWHDLNMNPVAHDHRRELHVDAINGSDTDGDGSATSPYRSIKKAVSVVPADRKRMIEAGLGKLPVDPLHVYIHPGVYREGHIWLTPPNSGTILEGTTTAEACIIDGSVNVGNPVIRVGGANGVTLRNLTLRNAPGVGVLANTLKGPSVIDCIFSNTKKGIVFDETLLHSQENRWWSDGGGTQRDISGNLFTNNGVGLHYMEGLSPEHGIRGDISGNTFEQNKVGFYIEGTLYGDVTDNIFIENGPSDDFAHRAAGFYITRLEGTLKDNTFDGNYTSATDAVDAEGRRVAGWGVGFYVSVLFGDVTENTFSQNRGGNRVLFGGGFSIASLVGNITHNTFTNNRLDEPRYSQGAGFYVSDLSGDVTYNTFDGNRAPEGAAFHANYMTGSVSQNEFMRNNTPTDLVNTGGDRYSIVNLRLKGKMTHNIFYENRSGTWLVDILPYGSEPEPIKVINNIFYDNDTQWGATLIYAGTPAHFLNNLFMTPDDWNPSELWIHCIWLGDYACRFHNNIFINFTGPIRSDTFFEKVVPITHNLFHDITHDIFTTVSAPPPQAIDIMNTRPPQTWPISVQQFFISSRAELTPDLTQVEQFYEGANNNIEGAPAFVDLLNRDFRPTDLSRVINRGTNAYASAIDFDGVPRPYEHTVDIGPHEYAVCGATPVNLREDVNRNGVVNAEDLALVLSQLGESGNTAADVNCDNRVDMMDFDVVANKLKALPATPFAKYEGLELTPTTVAALKRWLAEARQRNLTDETSHRRRHFIEQLLFAVIPKETKLLANYPNPFNPETWIPYELAMDTEVRLTIYNATGAVVRTLGLGHQPAGSYTHRGRAAYWDGRNALGEQVASGIYFYQLETDEMSSLRKMVILK